jgi:hypothetical protein
MNPGRKALFSSSYRTTIRAGGTRSGGAGGTGASRSRPSSASELRIERRFHIFTARIPGPADTIAVPSTHQQLDGLGGVARHVSIVLHMEINCEEGPVEDQISTKVTVGLAASNRKTVPAKTLRDLRGR